MWLCFQEISITAYVVVFLRVFGQTLGMKYLNLLLVSKDGTPISTKQSLLRRVPHFFGSLWFIPFPLLIPDPSVFARFLINWMPPLLLLLGTLYSLIDRHHRTLYDIWAGTVIVRSDKIENGHEGIPTFDL